MTEICVTFVLIVNREVLSVCIKLFWVGGRGMGLDWDRREGG